MAKRYFAGLEVDAIEALPEPQRQRRLLEHWTLKEAYLKARGYGLHLPTDGAAFTFGSDRQISSAFDHRMGDTPAGWRFGHLAPIHNHLIAYAVRPAANHPLRVRILDALLFN
jgi:4'-phosphopantetheinyl transferase